jgi:hypothetical protein
MEGIGGNCAKCGKNEMNLAMKEMWMKKKYQKWEMMGL